MIFGALGAFALGQADLAPTEVADVPSYDETVGW